MVAGVIGKLLLDANKNDTLKEIAAKQGLSEEQKQLIDHLAKGLKHFRNAENEPKLYEEAIRELQIVTKIDPAHIDANFCLGYIHSKIVPYFDPLLAEKHLQKAAICSLAELEASEGKSDYQDKQTQTVNILLCVIDFFESTKKFDEAVVNLSELCSLTGERPELMIRISKLLIKDGKEGEACEILGNLLEKDILLFNQFFIDSDLIDNQSVFRLLSEFDEGWKMKARSKLRKIENQVVGQMATKDLVDSLGKLLESAKLPADYQNFITHLSVARYTVEIESMPVRNDTREGRRQLNMVRDEVIKSNPWCASFLNGVKIENYIEGNRILGKGQVSGSLQQLINNEHEIIEQRKNIQGISNVLRARLVNEAKIYERKLKEEREKAEKAREIESNFESSAGEYVNWVMRVFERYGMRIGANLLLVVLLIIVFPGWFTAILVVLALIQTIGWLYLVLKVEEFLNRELALAKMDYDGDDLIKFWGESPEYYLRPNFYMLHRFMGACRLNILNINQQIWDCPEFKG